MSSIASEKLRKLVATLNAQEKCTNAKLLRLLEELAIKEEDIAAYQLYQHTQEESYGRNEIYTNERFRIYLMSWDAGDATAIHDHGGTDWGCVQFFGAATHCIYKYAKNHLTQTEKTLIPKGTIVPVVGSFIHLMANTGKESICTLHIYGRNTKATNEEEKAIVFQPEKGRMVTTSGTAYLNMSESEVIDTNEMPTMSQEDYQNYINIVSPFYKRLGTVL